MQSIGSRTSSWLIWPSEHYQVHEVPNCTRKRHLNIYSDFSSELKRNCEDNLKWAVSSVLTSLPLRHREPQTSRSTFFHKPKTKKWDLQLLVHSNRADTHNAYSLKTSHSHLKERFWLKQVLWILIFLNASMGSNGWPVWTLCMAM